MFGVVQLALIGLLFTTAYIVGYAIYNVFFHPLRRFPGPLLHGMTMLPRTRYHVAGKLPFHVADLHRRYGPVVRIAPNELAFCTPKSWHDIYGHRKAGQTELPKWSGFYRMFDHLPTSIFDADRERHGALRRQLAHGFSERSMREQEPIISSYADLLVSRLQAAIQETNRQDLQSWLNWTTFDMIGDLSFGVKGGFECLVKPDSRFWVQLISDALRQLSMVQAICRLGFHRPMVWLSKTGVFAEDQNRNIVYQKVGQRLASGARPDFLDGLIRKKEELGLTQLHLAMNARFLILAGSETSATLLSGTIFFLTTQPEMLRKLEEEVRSAFKSDNEITLSSIADLPYMLACLNETLRRYPPISSGLPRYVPEGGAMIDGYYVPSDTVISIFQWAINHNERFWTEPTRFAPERWLGDPKYKNDQFDAMQPFSVGPRNCIGRNLAYAEMRLLLAKMIFNFDISMDDESRDWIHRQKAFDANWVMPPLYMKVKPASRENRAVKADGM